MEWVAIKGLQFAYQACETIVEVKADISVVVRRLNQAQHVAVNCAEASALRIGRVLTILRQWIACRQLGSPFPPITPRGLTFLLKI
jgi:hypothetical protein